MYRERTYIVSNERVVEYVHINDVLVNIVLVTHPDGLVCQSFSPGRSQFGQ